MGIQRYVSSVARTIDFYALTPKPVSGIFGQLYGGVARNPSRPIKNFTPGPLTIKVIPLTTPAAQRAFIRDIEAIYKTCHPCCARVITWEYFPRGITEHGCTQGAVAISNFHTSLAAVLEDSRRGNSPIGFDDTKKSRIAFGIAFGMAYLHGQNMIHRDLKPTNVLLDDRFNPKITDSWTAGLCDSKTAVESATAKSLPYLAPELDDPEPVFGAADVYSFGIILAEMVTDDPPYRECDHMKPAELRRAIVDEGRRPYLPRRIKTTPIGRLIAACWDEAPFRRPTFEQIIEARDDLMFEQAAELEYRDFIWDMVEMFKPM